MKIYLFSCYINQSVSFNEYYLCVVMETCLINIIYGSKVTTVVHHRKHRRLYVKKKIAQVDEQV